MTSSSPLIKNELCFEMNCPDQLQLPNLNKLLMFIINGYLNVCQTFHLFLINGSIPFQTN